MRKVLVFFAFILASINGLAQISETEARQLYAEAEQSFESNNFYDCYVKCDGLIQKLGKSNPKILYLLLNSIHNNLEKKDDKSEYTLKKNYRNFLIFNQWIADFFSLVDKSQYPSEKYNEMLVLQKYFAQGLKAYEHEKDRKPEDAINFFRECITKFPFSFSTSRRYVDISLDSVYLKIVKTERISSGKRESIFRTIAYIDFSQITDIGTTLDIGGQTVYYIKGRTEYKFGEEVISGYVVKLEYLDFTSNKKAIYNFLNKVDESKPAEAFNNWTYVSTKEISSLWIPIILSIARNIDEYKKDNYEKRIADAFEFLIDFFPKKETKKAERTSKF